MLEVSLDKKRFYATLDPAHEFYGRAYIVLKSLLTTQEINERTFSVGYDDLSFLKDKMRAFGLLPHCTITDDAYGFEQWLYKTWADFDAIKKGSMDARILSKLNGKLKTPLYPDQIPAVAYILQRKKAGLFDDMGSGKTLISLAVMAALEGEVKRTLVICPNNVLFGFTRQIQEHTNFKAARVPPGKDALPFLKATAESDWDLLLIHPENLIPRNKEDVFGPTTEFLLSRKFDLIIIDEFHMYKNLSAKRTKCVLRLAREIKNHDGGYPRIIVMTGTPISETPTNAYTVLKVLGFDRMPSVSRFENYYCEKKKIVFGKSGKSANKIVGFKNLGELRTRIERVSIRRTKDEMTGFPDKVSVIRDVVLSGAQLAMYRSICGRIVKELSASTVINLQNWLQNSNEVLRLRQLMNHPNLLNEDGESAKYEEIDSILEELFENPEDKVVIWTAFRKSVENLYERYADLYGAVKIIGGVEGADFERVAYEFEHQDLPRVAICTAEKAGTGTDFLARARTSIYIDRPYSYTLYKQSMDRIHRRIKSQAMNKLDRIRSQPATLIFLDGVGTVDELVRDRLYKKSDMVSTVTDKEGFVEIGRDDLLKYFR